MTLPTSHLAQEAVAALVDGELPAGPAARAARHLEGCLECRLAVQAQREAKQALRAGADDVAVPGDLLSRLRAIPFTTEVPGGGGTLAASGDALVISGGLGGWSVPLAPRAAPDRTDQARWLRRGLGAGLAALGIGVTALALSLPSGGSGGTTVSPQQHTDVVPPVVRTVRSTAPGSTAPVGLTTDLGGTP